MFCGYCDEYDQELQECTCEATTFGTALGYIRKHRKAAVKKESKRLVNLRSRLAELRAWTLSCYRDEDDHGLRDAGADMAVVRAQIKLLEEFEK